MAKTLTNEENETHTMQDLEYGKKPENLGKGKTHCRKKLKQVENETHTLQDMEYVEKPEKCGK